MMKRTRRIGVGAILSLLAAFVFTSANLWAQGATPAPLGKVTLSGDAAKRALTKGQINADTARAIATIRFRGARSGICES